jgi:hypothetical protein
MEKGDWKVTGIARHGKDYAKAIKDYRLIECDLLAPECDLRKVLVSGHSLTRAHTALCSRDGFIFVDRDPR